jgi:hypothetical protein
MSFCANCGRQRSGTARFCGGCGAEYSDSPDEAAGAATSSAPGDPGTQPADVTHLEGPPAGVTRLDLHPEAGQAAHTDPPAAEPDPFANWYSPAAQDGGAPGAAGYPAGGQWQPTQTVGGTQATGYAPSGFPPGTQPPPGFPPPPAYPSGPPGAPPARGGGLKGLFIVVAVVVVLAAGGGAYALATSLGKHSSAQPPTQPTVGTSTPTGGTSPSSGTSAPASTSASATPSPTLSLVAIAPGVTAGAAQAQVETLLSHYFHGINTHSYTEYASTLTAQQQANEPQSAFDSGYSSTTDSGMMLTSLSDSGGGGLTATVTFTSHQSPAQSVDKSACNSWTLNLYLVPQGKGYLIGPAPSGYQPTYSDC